MRQLRARMVQEYLVPEGIDNDRVLQAMRTVPRHEFVRSNLAVKAYFDSALPIGYKQTISPPFIVAYMTQTIDPQPDDRVLEIGTGSGYQAAVLSGLCRDVYTIEIVEGLGRSAARRLKRLGYKNVHTKIGDGYKGWPEHAPFDKIIVTCSPEKVPQPLIDQLTDGGRMIIPLGERYQQVFYLFEKKDGKLERKALRPTLFVPMTGISEENREIKPDPLNPEIVNGSFELDANEDGRVDNFHYQRQVTLTTDDDAPDGERYICFENTDPGRSAQLLQGMPVDGRKIGSLKMQLSVRYANTSPGPNRQQQPALIVHFYNSVRRPIGEGIVRGWIGSSDWKKVTKQLRVPLDAREAVVRVGLNGATGRLCVDNLQLTPQER